MNDYSFSAYGKYASEGIAQAINKLNEYNKPPVIVCIGSDLVLGDSLGPLCGTMLKRKNLNAFIYGTLNEPITAKEVLYLKKYLSSIHPFSPVLAIDAAVGETEDLGIIKAVKRGLKPGLGVNKNLGEIGDFSLIGVVAKKSAENYQLFNLTRLGLVYKMAEVISSGVYAYISALYGKKEPFLTQNLTAV